MFQEKQKGNCPDFTLARTSLYPKMTHEMMSKKRSRKTLALMMRINCIVLLLFWPTLVHNKVNQFAEKMAKKYLTSVAFSFSNCVL